MLMKGHLEVYKHIANQIENMVTIQDSTGRAPIHYAVAGGHLEVVKYILDSKPNDTNLKDDEGRMPIHLACLFGHYEMCLVLLDHGSDPNSKDNDGTSAIGLCRGKYLRKSIQKHMKKLRKSKRIKLETL